MNDVAAKRKGLAFAQRLSARCLDSALRLAREPAPQDVVLPACVDSDNCPHLMIVGHDSHPGPPDDVQDRKIRRAMERLDLRAPRLAEHLENRPRRLDCAGHDLAY